MQLIGILCSGGDCPGMNAGIAAAAEQAALRGARCVGIRNGFVGLGRQEVQELDPVEVRQFANRGGAFLGTSRRPPDITAERLMKDAAAGCRSLGLSGLLVFGGNGTLAGLAEISSEIPCAGVPATIDNDLAGSALSIGFDTACQHGIAALDAIGDTAAALTGRIFTVQTLGGDTGHLAAAIAFAGFADAVLVPEIEEPFDRVRERVSSQLGMQGRAIVVVAEGARCAGKPEALLEEALGVRVRPTVLGHMQRGGSPTATDRFLARRLGSAAVDLLMRESSGAVTWDGADVIVRPLEEAARKKALDVHLYNSVWQ